MRELEAYDDIGVEYYYLADINKATYYHNRMMECDLEGQTVERAMALENLAKSRTAQAYKRDEPFASAFDAYRIAKRTPAFADQFRFIHEDRMRINRVEQTAARIERKQPLVSPRFRQENIKDRLLVRAFREIQLSPDSRSTGRSASTEENIARTPTSLRCSADTVRRLTRNSGAVLQLANKLFKTELRRYNMASRRYTRDGRRKLREEERPGTELRSRNGLSRSTISMYSIASQKDGIPLDPNLRIDVKCNYSHLGETRSHVSRGEFQANCYLGISHKLDSFGRFIQQACCEDLKRFGADERLVQEFLQLAARAREQHGKGKQS